MSLVLKKARKELGPTSGWPKLQECEHVKTSRKNIFVKKQKVVESARGEGQNYRIWGDMWACVVKKNYTRIWLL